jgi:hypothetical protein
MRSVSYQRKVGDQFFSEFLVSESVSTSNGIINVNQYFEKYLTCETTVCVSCYSQCD